MQLIRIIFFIYISTTYCFSTYAISLSNGFADIVEPLIPTVVNIYINKKAEKDNSGDLGKHLKDLFSKNNLNDQEGVDDKLSAGSGFIVSTDGYIVTNHHVIDGTNKIFIKLHDQKEYPVILIGSDIKTDIALLKIKASHNLPSTKFGKSDKVRIGDWAIAIGNPYGLRGSVTAGIISSKARDISIDNFGLVDDFIQTDAAINIGNSGGPLFNVQGEVIGMNTVIVAPDNHNTGIGFAIPSSTITRVIDQLKKNGKVTRAKLGIIIHDLSDELAETLGHKENDGAFVAHVEEGGAADKAGVKQGDIIIKFNNQEVKDDRKLRILIADTPINSKFTVKVFRDNKLLKLHGTTKAEDTKIEPKQKTKFHIQNITFAIKPNHNKVKQNIVYVDAINSKGENSDLLPGDTIISINKTLISNIEELSTAILSAKEKQLPQVIILIERQNVKSLINLPIK